MLEAVLNVANSKARIPCCGMISQYNVQDKEGIRNMFMVSLLHSLDALYVTGCCQDYAMSPELAALRARLVHHTDQMQPLYMHHCHVQLSACCCAVLCCAVLCCAVLCCAVLCCAVLCCAVLCCAVRCHVQLIVPSSSTSSPCCR